MKRIFIFLILIGCISSCFGQENLTLSLELVKPSGKIDRKSYFLARLKNHNDSLNIFVVYGGDGYLSYLRCSYFKVIYDVTGKSEYMPIMKKTDGSKHFYPKQSINLYSNWIGINGKEFLPALLKDVQPDD